MRNKATVLQEFKEMSSDSEVEETKQGHVRNTSCSGDERVNDQLVT